jgi:hypothetical protein
MNKLNKIYIKDNKPKNKRSLEMKSNFRLLYHKSIANDP